MQTLTTQAKAIYQAALDSLREGAREFLSDLPDDPAEHTILVARFLDRELDPTIQGATDALGSLLTIQLDTLIDRQLDEALKIAPDIDIEYLGKRLELQAEVMIETTLLNLRRGALKIKKELIDGLTPERSEETK